MNFSEMSGRSSCILIFRPRPPYFVIPALERAKEGGCIENYMNCRTLKSGTIRLASVPIIGEDSPCLPAGYTVQLSPPEIFRDPWAKHWFGSSFSSLILFRVGTSACQSAFMPPLEIFVNALHSICECWFRYISTWLAKKCSIVCTT